MGRKRLLTILAAVTAAVTLQVGPAAAATDDGCLVLGQDVTVLQLVKLDPALCVVDSAGKLVQGTIEETTEKTTETVKKTTETTTKAVEDTTKKVTESVSGDSSTPAPAPSPKAPAPAPTAPKSDGGGETGGSTPAPRGGSSGSSDVATSGEVREPQVRDEAREQQLGALRAIRSDLAAGTPFDRGMAGPVQPFGGLTTTDDLAAPQVADSGQIVPGVDGLDDPQIAPAPEQREAVLANSSPMRDIAEAPLALQLLAAALVLGAATVWTIASRELGRGQSTTA